MFKNTWVVVILVILLLLIAIFSGVALLTRNSFSLIWDLSNQQNLATSINGLSAPIISFFSAVLIFITFREQNKANKAQFEANKRVNSQWEFETYLGLFTEIKNSYENVRVSYNSINGKFKVRRGQKAIETIIEKEKVNGVSYALVSFTRINDEFLFLILNVVENKFGNTLLVAKMQLYYQTHMHGVLQRLKTKYETSNLQSDKNLVKSIDDLSQNIDRLSGIVSNPVIP